MSAALQLARPQDLDRVGTMVAAFHAEAGLEVSHDQRRDALSPLLDGSPHGCVYLIGPVRAPIGYVVVTFGWSVEFGGMDAFIDEIYVRPAVRGRGIATEVLTDLPPVLGQAGVRALHLEVERSNDAAHSLYRRTGFRARSDYTLMTRML